MRQKLLNALFQTDIDYYTKTKLGDIANTLTTNSLWAGLMVQYLAGFYCFILISIIYLVILLTISAKLTLISLVIIAVIPLLVRKQTVTLRTLSKTIEKTNAELHTYLVDKLRYIKRILLLNRTKYEEESFCTTSRSLEKALVRGLKLRSLVNAALEPVFFLAVILIIFVSIELLKINFSVLIIFIYVLSRLTPQIKGVVNCRNQVLIYNRSFDRIQRTYQDIRRATTIIDGTVPFEGLKEAITFRNVRFSYDPDNALFESLSLKFEKNQTTAIVGKSGAGKSTIVDLILRFRDVDDGSILIDDIDIRELNIASYRRKIAVVTQDVMLFHGTVLENITYGLSGITADEIDTACKMAHVDEFVMQLKNGYESNVGEAGSELSGGQKQRLALAHMFLQKPDIIVLDEPTSALDSESEKVVKEAIAELRGRRTIIIIAHQLSTIKEADKIIFLDNGISKAEGVYDELIKQDRRFREMVDLQRL
jgi:subfamily B ATP-binding cassette protein MsbA